MTLNLQRIQRIAQRHGVKLDPEMVSGIDLSNVSSVMRNHYEFECFDSEGKLKWKDSIDNIYVNQGLNDVLDKYLKGSGYTAAFYVGLTDGTPTVAAGDTLASHVGWVEITAYLQSPDVKPTLTLGSVASQSVDNSASKATFSITGTATVGGAFITTNDERVLLSPATGLLIAAGAFTGGDKSVTNGDTLNVTVTLTASSS